MIFKTIFGLLLTLAMVGCGHMTSYDKSTAPMSATSDKEVLRGLQSLQRVQLKLPEAPHAVRDDAIEQLRELLPQLDTAGTTDDWTLEFAFGVSIVGERMIRNAGPPARGPVRNCRCRLVRTVVVDGRAATAIAYEGPPVTGPAPLTWTLGTLMPFNSGKDSEKQLRRHAIAVFAKAWRQANPDTHQK